MVIANSSIHDVLFSIMDGETIGTLFQADNVHPQMKKRQIIIGSAIKGRNYVDKGCRRCDC